MYIYKRSQNTKLGQQILPSVQGDASLQMMPAARDNVAGNALSSYAASMQLSRNTCVN